jgi:23S rRNA (pseudouridine1915-N3)-methyltransferase
MKRNPNMNITILCVGKLKEQYWIDATFDYSQRLSKYCTLQIDEIKESDRDDKNEEGANILKRIKKEDYVITLEIKGKHIESEDLAKTLETLAAYGKSKIVFVIGGSEGLSKEVSDRADFRLSFSKMTFPHRLARVMLLEQIYRSFKIIKNEKYHK